MQSCRNYIVIKTVAVKLFEDSKITVRNAFLSAKICTKVGWERERPLQPPSTSMASLLGLRMPCCQCLEWDPYFSF